MKEKNIMIKFIKVRVLAMAFVLVFATLASCGKSIDKIEEKAKDAGYEVIVEKLDEADEDGLVAYMSITEKEATSFIPATAVVYEFEDANTAKEAYEELEKELGEEAELLGQTVKRSGKIIIVGDEAIIKKVW